MSTEKKGFASKNFSTLSDTDRAMIVVTVLFAGLCAAILIMIILGYVDNLSKGLQSTVKPEKKNLTAVILPGTGTGGPTFLPLKNVTLSRVRIGRSAIPYKDRQTLQRCFDSPSEPYVLTSSDDLYPDVTLSKSNGNNTYFNFAKPTPDQCSSTDDVLITMDTKDGDTRYLAYNDDSRCEDTTVSMSNYISKKQSTLQGCFSLEQDPAFPSYARLIASRRSKCDKRHLNWDPNCSGRVRIGNANVPDASQFEWRIEKIP